jgi:metallo-beta-lactamase family protein
MRHGGDLVAEFLGGAGTVTGSKTLLTVGSSSVMVDCGLFQGLRELRRRNWEPLDLDPTALAAVLLTHAHLDHCGYLPALVAQGFRGPIYATSSTAELAAVVLRDSAHLLAEDADHASRHGYSKHKTPRPLYTAGDVERTLTHFQPVEHGQTLTVSPGMSALWRRSGHILGSSTLHLEVAGTTVSFSGDLGRPNHPLLRGPEPLLPSRHVIVESTYGNRTHPSRGEAPLAALIQRTLARGGNVLIPAFAVDRTEVILMALRDLMVKGTIPKAPVYVDSPMALTALGIYRQAVQRRDPEIREGLGAADEVFDPGTLHELHTPDESRSINDPDFPCIIVSASGMATGGRVLHHLEHLLPDPRNTVVLAGYQAVGTRGRQLLDGETALKMHGRYVPVRAEVAQVDEFSVHADSGDLLDWLATAPEAPECCYVVHGEPDAAHALQQRIRSELGWLAIVPRMGERVRMM